MKMVGECWGWRARRLARWAGSGALLAASLGASAPALADGTSSSKKVAVGFSNLVARLDNDEIGFANAQYRVHILEALRDAGFNAVGAENLVFGKDDAERADVVLGGTVKELKCRQMRAQLRCRVGIEWQLLDRERDQIVYRVLTRFAGLDLPRNNDAVVGKTLTLGALRSLMNRERFKNLLNAEHAALPDDADYAPATFARCEVPPRELPTDFDAIAAGTLLIKSGGGTGSGFGLTADGLVMTAAHVVSASKVEVRTRDGKTLPARVVRMSHKQDVALLSLGDSGAKLPCLSIEPTPQTPGTDVYAIGSPGGEELAFSLSRGIVSGLRLLGDVPLIQTDASLSPGNSGGPLVDHQGRVVGVVSRKIAGHAVEGLGFAIPIQAGLLALKLEAGPSTTSSLLQAPPPTAKPISKQSVNDSPDALVSLDPEGDRQRALAEDLAQRKREQKANTPGYVMPVRWTGFVLGVTASLGVIATWSKAENEQNRHEWESLRLKNDLFWAGTLLGWGAFTTSYFLVPKLGPSQVGRAPRWSVAAGPADLKLNVSFQ
jgi:S1-C subfamily serine protease